MSIWPLALSTIEYRARDKVTMEFKGGVPDGMWEGCGLWGVGCGVWPGHSTQRNLISERHLNSMRTIIAGNLNLPTFCDSIQLPCQADDSMTSDGPRLPPPTAR